MNSPACELLGIEFPLMAFSHCRGVVVEVVPKEYTHGAVNPACDDSQSNHVFVSAQTDTPYSVIVNFLK